MWTRLYPGRGTRARWTAAIGGMILLVTALASGFDAGLGGQCVTAGGSATHAGHLMRHRLEIPRGSAAWEQPAPTRCPHCPSQQCAHTLPCAVTLTGALPSSDIGFDVPLPHRVGLHPDRTALQLSPHQPPTPPPQPVA